MKRRHFICVATTSLALPAALKASSALPFSTNPPERARAFFDQRFEAARRRAAAWAASQQVIAVTGDITPTWLGGLNRLARTQPLELRGITTESFRFCLKILIEEHAGIDQRVSRIDRNLLLWTMRTVPKSA